MPSSFRQLDTAATPHEIVSIVRDYFAQWTPEEIALLPEACRPPHIRDSADVEELHRAAVDAFRDSRATGEALTLLRKLTGFVAAASVRLAKLGHPAAGGGGEAVTPPKRMAAGRDR
jgi:hypothetical protein